jgi:putative spermidine/putrescine transport system substrate-binding protein
MSNQVKGLIAIVVVAIIAVGGYLIFKPAPPPPQVATPAPSTAPAAPAPATTAETGALTIVSWGGAYQDSQREAYYKPFMKDTSAKITEEEYDGEYAKLKAQVEAKNVSWDVIDVDANHAISGCDDGLLEKLDYSKIGQPKEKFVVGGALDCAVATIVYATVFAYDADKLKDGPKTLADFFDTTKFPGKRGLLKKPFGNLEWALIADGVPNTDVYKVLATPEGVDRAFKKLDTIKKDVVWWDAGAVPPQLLSDGQVVMTSAWNGRIFNTVKKDKKNFVIVWDQQELDFDYWVIPAGTPRKDLAYKFLAYASDPNVMANQSKYISYGPSHADAIPKIAPDVLKDLPTAPENMKTAFTIDSHFWADNNEQLTERFNAWLAGT